jgi:type I restriction enzyme S subunit
VSGLKKRSVPSSWAISALSGIADVVRGVTYKKENARGNPAKGLTAVLRATNITGSGLTFDQLVYVPENNVSDEQLLRDGDVVIASSSGSKEIVGKAGQIAGSGYKGSFGAFCVAIRPDVNLHARYIGYYFQSPEYRNAIADLSAGSNINNLKISELSDHLIPVAGLSEQTRIVEKLEELLSDLDAGVAELKAAQKKLARYRQSLLKAAVEGELTAEWRAERARRGEANESGAQLLARILAERRTRWEAKQLAKFKEQGKVPPKDWSSKYPAPSIPDASLLPQLPDSWIWASLDSLISEIEAGSSFKCLEVPPKTGDVGVVKVSAVSWGEYDEQESKTCTDPDRIDKRLFVRAGDFLFSRANTIELVGACVIAKRVTLPVMLSDKILRFHFVEDDLKGWVLHCLQSRFGREQIENLASGNQESMRNIGQEKLRQISVPLPPSSDVQVLLLELERQLEGGRSQDDAIRIALNQSVAQRKNILKAAFAGQLVPQDPNDEPASVLLERIRAERNEKSTAAKPAKAKKKASMA